MTVALDKVGKRYLKEWIIKDLSTTFESGRSYAITGPNGSGKSTLLQLISGHITPTTGSVSYQLEGKEVHQDQVYTHLAFAAPYMEVVEEFTLREFIAFHTRFRSLGNVSGAEAFAELTGLSGSEDKEIRNYSSGMKQRVRLGLALASDASLILLDEPGTNLDAAGREWYRDVAQQVAAEKTMLVASNVSEEHDFCSDQLDLSRLFA